MYFKYDYLPQRYFTPERCLPLQFKDKIVDNDFEFVTCNRLVQPNRYYYYDSNSDMMFHQYVMKSNLGIDLANKVSPVGPLLRSHESTLVGLALKESKKPFPKWRCIFPIKTGYYLLYNFEQAYRTAFDLLMGKFGIEGYQIYYAKKMPYTYSDEAREYILHFLTIVKKRNSFSISVKCLVIRRTILILPNLIWF